MAHSSSDKNAGRAGRPTEPRFAGRPCSAIILAKAGRRVLDKIYLNRKAEHD
jgi:hypothetical protein